MSDAEQTGVHQAMDAAVSIAGWSVSVRSWRFWITTLVVLLAGDHAGWWDIDSLFAEGHLTHPQDLVTIIAGAMAVISALGRRHPGQRASDR